MRTKLARRDPLAALHLALRCSSPGDGEVAAVIEGRFEGLRRVLDLEALAAFDDGSCDNRERLRALVADVLLHRRAVRSLRAAARLAAAVTDLARTAAWRSDGVFLDPQSLFQLVACTRARVLQFEVNADVVHVSRRTLAEARRALADRDDVIAYIGRDSLHLRWRGGRGGLNLRCPAPRSREPAPLIVPLEHPAARPSAAPQAPEHPLSLTG